MRLAKSANHVAGNAQNHAETGQELQLMFPTSKVLSLTKHQNLKWMTFKKRTPHLSYFSAQNGYKNSAY